jgi:hypothetical protein
MSQVRQASGCRGGGASAWPSNGALSQGVVVLTVVLAFVMCVTACAGQSARLGLTVAAKQHALPQCSGLCGHDRRHGAMAAVIRLATPSLC